MLQGNIVSAKGAQAPLYVYEYRLLKVGTNKYVHTSSTNSCRGVELLSPIARSLDFIRRREKSRRPGYG